MEGRRESWKDEGGSRGGSERMERREGERVDGRNRWKRNVGVRERIRFFNFSLSTAHIFSLLMWGHLKIHNQSPLYLPRDFHSRN